ncbi:MAG TPA: hypothetical protein VFS67_20635 [Polyangiaceae bacterium]|nr:hypothetical protein [Polyangiaceae bacterium]
MSVQVDPGVFDVRAGFDAGQVGGGLELGPYAEQYRELFADVLGDGVITAEERERLTRVARNLGMDPHALEQLERAMIAAYEAHHRVAVVERWQTSEELSATASAAPRADAPDLLTEIARLRSRILVLEEELREARAHVNVEVDFSSLEEAAGDDPLDRLRAKIVRDPTNPKLFSTFYDACERAGDRDAACRAARVLVLLGGAGPEHRRRAKETQTEGLIAPSRSLGMDHWLDELSHSSLSVVTSHILSLVTPAALVGRAATLQRDKKLPQVAEADRQDVAKSTVTAVRALGWAAAVLGMPAPSVFADPARDIGYTHVPAMPPWSLLGKRVLSGCMPREHAFLAGRHLTFYRAEFFARVLFPEVAELESLFLAALLLGNPALPIPEHLKGRVGPLCNALTPLLDASQIEELRRQYKAFAGGGGRTNLLAWGQAADKTAARAGLLLCDDIAIAAQLLEREEGPRGPLLADLLGFAASAEYGTLRRHLGIAIE